MKKLLISVSVIILVAVAVFVYIQYFSDKTPKIILLNPTGVHTFTPGETITVTWRLDNFDYLETVDTDKMHIAIGVIDANEFGGTGIAKYMIGNEIPVQAEHTVTWTIPDNVKQGQYRFTIDYYRMGGRGPNLSRLTSLGIYNSPEPFTIEVSER